MKWNSGSATTESFNQVFAEHKRALFLTAFRILGDEQEAWDLVQSSYLKLWKNRESIQEIENIYAWLRRTLINACLDQLRMKKQRKKKESYIKELYEIESEAKQDELLIRKKEVERVVKALPMLSPKERVTFSLFIFEGLGSKEIARQIGIAPSTVRNQIMKARKKLKSLLEEEQK